MAAPRTHSAFWISLLALAAGCTLPATGRRSVPATATADVVTTALALAATEPLPSPSLTESASLVTAAAATPTVACSDRAALIDDITVRDFTPLAPGEVFVKVWRLQNTGTCTWTPAYALVFFGGERMQAPASVPLAGPVPPGAAVDLSVEMTAPALPATYQSFWRLRNAAGEHFGLGASGDQSFWVRIVVRPGRTPTLSPTPPPTPSPTPAVVVSAALDLAAGSTLDLDSGALNPEAGADIGFGDFEFSGAALKPLSGTLISLYSPPPDPPRPLDCLAAPLRPEPIPAALLGPGSVACYLTGRSHPGYLVVVYLGDTLSLAFTTWVP